MAIFVAFPASAEISCSRVYQKAVLQAPKSVKPSRQFPSKSPTVEEMRIHLTGVHMTDYLPLGGVIRTSTTTESRSMPLSTLHFALGEMVISHPMGNWEKKKYALLVPFKNLEPQLMTVFHQDTFILGDLKLRPGTLLLAPTGEKVPSIPGVKVIRFDPTQRKIRDVIREVLEENDQWTFKSDGASMDSKVRNNRRNMNNREFFKHLLDLYPHLTHKLHSQDLIGKFEVETGYNFEVLFSNKKSYGRDEFEQVWRIEAMELRGLLESMNQRMASVTHPLLKTEYEKIRQRFQGRINIMQAESALQIATGKSLLDSPNLPGEFRQEVLRLADNFEALLQYLMNNAGLLRPKKEPDDEDLSNQIRNELHHLRSKLSLSQMSQFLRENPDIAEIGDGQHFQESMKKIEDAIRDKDHEGNLQLAAELLKSELSTCKPSQCWSYVYRLVERQFEPHVLAVLAVPEVWLNLSKYFDLSIFKRFRLGPYGDIRSYVWLAKEARKETDPIKREKFVANYVKDNLILRPEGLPAAPH